jgi:predicted pyridoxine 5'-phosphate oxidase superfamily flavin-nucleotide-binding protein
MRQNYLRQLFTPAVKARQSQAGSRAAYERAAARADDTDGLGPDEERFLAEADHFFLATVGETGWPYVQHRGGPPGFVQVLGPRQIGYAEFRGNQQFISAGNVAADPRASILVMDYANQARLKLIGQMRFVAPADADPALRERLIHADYPGRVERIALFDVQGFDWNCPQHIVPRYTREQVESVVAPLRERLARLESKR